MNFDELISLISKPLKRYERLRVSPSTSQLNTGDRYDNENSVLANYEFILYDGKLIPDVFVKILRTYSELVEKDFTVNYSKMFILRLNKQLKNALCGYFFIT
uniref:Uncharacterized protein n=1 Tax=Glossina pallidipes TaxID=7398 RepID=A0A1A9ZN52_GLOPL